jgi:pimeloyl-ACP methyl ester carboxylesterase
MTKRLYALLVGIDQYPSPVSSLQGCINDVGDMETYLRGRTAGGEFQLHLRTLRDSEAKRQALIDAFRQHLYQAGPDDVALFYYSGHGSQEPAPAEFWPIEPDHMNETLVCWDSRLPGGWDLADKELAHLIAGVAANGAHVVIILDSCHSGSATRDLQPQSAVRWIPAGTRPRPLDTFIFAPSELGAQRSTDPSANPSGWLALPEGRHILLAACRDEETAKEYAAAGKTWGAFSYFMHTTLKSRGTLTYRDLFKQTQARVRANVWGQSPQLEATQFVDLDQLFLGGAIAPRPAYFTVSYIESDWRLDAGAIHGIPPRVGDETTTLALFALDTPAERLRDLTGALGQAQVVRVEPQSSQVRLVDIQAPDPNRTYKAVVTSVPMPPLGVWLEGDADGLRPAREALGLSLYVQEAASAPRLRLLAREGQYTLTRPDDERPLVARIQGYGADSARLAVRQLEHIARWMRTVDLRNPASHIPPDAIAFSILKYGVEQDPGELLFEYERQAGQWQKPSYVVRLKNQSDQTLYCTVLGLWESFAIDVLFSQQPVVKLEPGQEFSRQIWASVPEEVWQQGITDRQDILKLIACTADFDATLLTQGKLDAPRVATRVTRSVGPQSTLHRLMKRVQTREATDQAADEVYVDWATAEIVMTIRRPLESQPVPRSGQILSLGAGVTLEGHPALVARARLGVVPPVSRDLGSPGLPPILRQPAFESQPFCFRVTRGLDTSENMLELSDVEDYAVVTPDSPLRMAIASPLNRGEHVMAFGFDGEFYLPLGFSRSDGNRTRIDLQRLPAPYGTRDLRGAVRILFQKFVAKPLGLGYAYPLLAAVQVSQDGQLHYERDLDKIKMQVARAQRIALYVHGWTGDTRGMVASAPHYQPGDVLLAFDYESIHTSIEETARGLKERLEAVGLRSGGGKKLMLIAHSLGGLVARWFIEREGGDELVRHLVILGTPSNGTPWSTIQQWATLGIGLALNGLSTVAWPVKVLGALISAFEKIDVTMDQFQPGSEFLKSMAASPDPHVRYTLIAGNTSIIPAALQTEPGQSTSRLGRLLTKLGYDLASLAFFDQPNDIAVSVESVKAVSAKRAPRPQAVEVACDHVTFFDSPAGLEALVGALK